MIEGIILRCDGSSSYDSDRGVIVDYTWDIYGERILHGQQIELELSRFGEHRITLRVRNSSGVPGEKHFLITASQTYLKPNPDFSWDMGLQKNVSFNAQRSLEQSRKVISYEWDFGDGTTLVTVGPELSYNYISYGKMNVVLTVTDELGATQRIEKEVYVHDPIVPKPGPQNNETILGIDTNNNEVRDDVERWIYRVTEGNELKENTLFDIAIAYQHALVNREDDVYLRDLGTLIGKRLKCLEGIDLKDASVVFESLKAKIFSTEARYLALLKIENNSSFVQGKYPEDNFAKEDYCN